MRTNGADSFERFLVEDVLITLGNLRGALGWLADPEAGMGAESLRHGIARIESQIDALQDRAAAVCRDLRPAGAESGALDGVEMSLDRLLRDAMGGEGGEPEFRSSRRGQAA